MATLLVGGVEVEPQLHDGTPIPEGFYATIQNLLETAELKKWAMAMAKFKHPDLQQSMVVIKARRKAPSRVIYIFAEGDEPHFTQVFLDCVLDSFCEHRGAMWEMEFETMKGRREGHLEELRLKLSDAKRALAREKTDLAQATVTACERALHVATDAQTRWELDMAGRVDVVSILERATKAIEGPRK